MTKRRTCRVLAFLLLLLLLPAMLVAKELSLPDFYQDAYYAQLAPMVKRLDESEGKRLILVGGSSAAFGTDTALLESLLAEKGFSYTVCPMGLYAALGTSAMLSISASALREGDIVLLSIEPTSDTMSLYFGASAYWKCAESAPALLLRLNQSQRAAAIGNYISYLQERCAVLDSGSFPKAEGVYSKAAFDESCNLVYARPGNIMPLGFDSASPIDLANLVIAPDFAQQVRAYCQTAREKGATVYLTFAPMNRSALLDASPATVSAFFQQCCESFTCDVISSPYEAIYDSGWFYDSNYHLNTAGSQVRTVSLAKDVLAALGCFEAIDFTLPTMPAAAVQTTVDTENNSADFTFVPFADGAGYLVDGLTESALGKTALTVPSSYMGKPVVGLTSTALNEAASLEELTLPETIETLPAHLFSGCPAIQRLILAHQTPCGLDEHALDEAQDIRIFVPASAYTSYRDGYGCQANPWQAWINQIYTY